MFKHKTGIATSIAAGMFIAFSGMTATAQQTTAPQSGTSGQQTPTTNQQTGNTDQQTQTGNQQSGNTNQQEQTNTPQNQSQSTTPQSDATSQQNQTGGTQSGTGTQQNPPTSATQSGTTNQQSQPTSGQQSETMSQGQGANKKMSGSASGSMVSNDDRKFMMAAAEGGMAEVEMARIALEKASSDSVKQYAQKMIDDHTKANDKLKEIASQKGVTLPTAADAKRQRTLERLRGLSGADFDGAYIKEAGNKDHEKQAKLFQKQAERGKDAEAKAFASETLPTVEMHLKMARDMAGQMGGGSMKTSDKGSSTNQSSGSGNQSTTTPRP